MKPQPTYQIGSVLEVCTEKALREWRDYNAPKVPICDLLAYEVQSFSVQGAVFRGGRLFVTVYIKGRQQWNDHTYIYNYRRHGDFWRDRDGQRQP